MRAKEELAVACDGAGASISGGLRRASASGGPGRGGASAGSAKRSRSAWHLSQRVCPHLLHTSHSVTSVPPVSSPAWQPSQPSSIDRVLSRKLRPV
eukprot:scaffold3709_cov68-Phaeocystis_antarctica.AAC.8